MIATADSDMNSGLRPGIKTRIGIGIGATVVSIGLLPVMILLVQ